MPDIHPTAIVHDNAKIGAGAEIGPFCIVGAGAVIGRAVRLISHVVVEGLTEIGEHTVVHSFAVLGGPPQHLAHKGEATRLVIGERNILREHVTMHTGTAAGRGVTTVGSDGLFMVGSHVAHDCIVGDHVVFANSAAAGGHVEVGDYVFMGGLSAAHQWTRIGRHAFIGGLAPITRDVIPYALVGNDAHLEGMNLVGLKRRGFARDTINDLRTAYRMLFAKEGTLQERLDDVARVFGRSAEVSEVVAFIRAEATRPLCTPKD